MKKRQLRKLIREEVRRQKAKDPIQEDFTREEIDELSYIIRREISELFYDLFRHKNFWINE